MPYFSSLKSSDEQKDIIILSRYRIQSYQQFQVGFQTGALLVNLVDTPLGNISVINVDLHETNEDNRLQEIEAVLSFDQKFPMWILLGNLNSISPSDSDPRFDQRFEVMHRIAAEGLVDVIALRNKLKKSSR